MTSVRDGIVTNNQHSSTSTLPLLGIRSELYSDDTSNQVTLTYWAFTTTRNRRQLNRVHGASVHLHQSHVTWVAAGQGKHSGCQT